MEEVDDLPALEDDLRQLRDALIAAEVASAKEIGAVHARYRRSAENLVALGLSSLGRAESHVLATIEAVLSRVAEMNGHEAPASVARVSVADGEALLDENTERLLGPPPAIRSTRIMVTLPTEAAAQPDLVASFAANGMDLARVNCAHDDEPTWAMMISHVRSLSGLSPPRVAMDLGGPKLRTGPFEPGPQVVRISPKRDRFGRVVAPAVLLLVPDGAPHATDDELTVIPVVDRSWLGRRVVGDELDLIDSRGSRRRWIVVEVGRDACTATTDQTAYVETGSKLTCDGDDATVVGELPNREQEHRIARGDRLVLTRDLVPAVSTAGAVMHRIGCTLGEVFDTAERGQRVLLDDGKIGGVIERVTRDEIELTITAVRPGGANLKAGKGINLPDTELRIAALTEKDLADLPFVARNADIVSLSFTRTADDVAHLQRELSRLGASEIGIVLKIENVAAFDNLPQLLLAAMRSERIGVMIARGDLAVEVGFERLAEVQEEILWACEAAHIPVIWATQVLDTLARTGQASRAEVTDAAMSERAECVMLNKGPFIAEAIEALDSILVRMQDHQHKKRSLLRRLNAWDRTRPRP
jgi:pyruvate kinase